MTKIVTSLKSVPITIVKKFRVGGRTLNIFPNILRISIALDIRQLFKIY